LTKTNLGEALRKNSQTSRVPRSPFDFFSRISFKKTTLRAELAFGNLRATLTKRIQPFNFFLVIKSKKILQKHENSTELFGRATENGLRVKTDFV
jgi:hypothetical protein